MVFQNFNLFPHLTALENVIEAQPMVKGLRRDEIISEAEALLRKGSLLEKQHSFTRRGWPAARSSVWPLSGAVHVAGHHAFRRTDFGARSGADQRGSARHA